MFSVGLLMVHILCYMYSLVLCSFVSSLFVCLRNSLCFAWSALLLPSLPLLPDITDMSHAYLRTGPHVLLRRIWQVVPPQTHTNDFSSCQHIEPLRQTWAVFWKPQIAIVLYFKITLKKCCTLHIKLGCKKVFWIPMSWWCMFMEIYFQSNSN